MSTNPESRPPAPPPRHLPPPPPRPGLSFLGCAFTLSFLANLLAAGVILVLCIGLASTAKSSFNLEDANAPLEKFFVGSQNASSKVAVVSLEGVIMEGLLGSVHKQIEQAAKDDSVKAVVFRVNSPGGSITASADLHARLLRLRDGDPEKKTPAKHLVVSMGSVAASGGYFVAVPAKTVFAERSTLTGSIGVYASFLNVHQLTDTYGVKMNTIKAGDIKDSGSSFAEMTPRERQVWQDMVNDAYDQFLTVVEKGRPALTRTKLLERFTVKPIVPDPKAGPTPPDYSRYRADGGIFTAPKALELGLVDSLGDLEEAVKAVAKLADLGEDYKAIKYEKQWNFLDFLHGSATVPPSGNVLDPNRWKAVLSPRMWYLAPGYEAAGLLSPPTP